MSTKNQPASKSYVDATVQGIADVCVAEFKKVADACMAMEKRIKELEGRQLSYEGIWREDRGYGKGAMVTHAGGIWHCEQGSQGDMPGRSNAWKLAVKSGGK